ncbi:hypothetical protein AVDCRST_MAG92-4941 [uncultured Coleofasciculus sp.]|uniref:Uncharacterized protein n=1 Tax=uncultured Coleofasciculus sp. TaxID=1267456 RepID=A0A6J4K9Y1_9CYAN|nr:hypothetical protein AVDCRST_MAG92-4941 [uncultured Coleofasciculus sp.]
MVKLIVGLEVALRLFSDNKIICAELNTVDLLVCCFTDLLKLGAFTEIS